MGVVAVRARWLVTIVALAAFLPPTAAVAGTGARVPGHAVRPETLRGAASRSWQSCATPDRHPLRHVEGPATPRDAAVATGPTPGSGCRRAAGGDVRRRTAPVTGEGIASLTLAAPGTSWASPTDTAVVVDLGVDSGPTQQIVLFDGGQPFTYQAFLGRLTTGPHRVTVTVDPGRSTDLAAPVVRVYSVRLGVVPSASPAYQVIAHAPVLYGRSSSSQRNAQILTDATRTPDPDGHDLDLSYTVIWTREDVGDGIVPAYEWGLWGRMTDIETVLHEKVAPDGRVLAAEYLSCGCEQAPAYPDELPAPPVGSEDDVPYPRSGTPARLGNHVVLRDATGNNDMSPFGTSAFRFQQVPVAGPAPGEAREAAMDAHPWTYRLSNDEITRTTVQSTDPRDPAAGNYPQYLIVDIDAAASGTSSIAVGVRLAGDPTWWTDDYAQTTGEPTTFPFYNGGHARTVIKLPPDWHASRIAALRLVLNAAPGGVTPTLRGTPTIRLIEVTKAYRVRDLPVPVPEVSTGTQVLPGLPG